MKRIYDYYIPEEKSNMTVSCFLNEMGYSRHIITHLKKTDHGICLNGVDTYTNQRLHTADHLRISLIEEMASEQIIPVPLPISIVYEDEDIMIVNKAANTPIHPSINHYYNTLANGICWYFHQQGIPFVFRCINRLDRDTTGLLMIAKNMLSASILSQMTVQRKIHREYLAIALGIVPKSGIIDAPIARKENSAIERCVDYNNGDYALTHFQRVCYGNEFSLVKLKLETGRTHQIRVHMNHINHSLVGDFLYHPKDAYNLKMQKRMQRQALHSHSLQFVHPITGKGMKFTAPLPEDMEWILAL